ncbi:MAG: HD domain-containing protein [Ardenticatenaceae bacterium]|nr:HD domain-containing protein [Ardenticatenaceae bacterium]
MIELQQQLSFIIEIDQLKHVLRKSILVNGERVENSAEHSWHLAMMAMILQEHANEPVDVNRVIKQVLVHDIVEIDAGDTYAYDEDGHNDKEEREQQAAERLFGLLPGPQRDELMALWHEFEARETPEAKFANAIDRVMPLIHNIESNGTQWKKYRITRPQVEKRMAPVKEGSIALAKYVDDLLDQAVADGLLEAGQIPPPVSGGG